MRYRFRSLSLATPTPDLSGAAAIVAPIHAELLSATHCRSSSEGCPRPLPVLVSRVFPPLARKAAHVHGRLASNSGTVSKTAPGSRIAASQPAANGCLWNASSCVQLLPVAVRPRRIWRGVGGRIGGRSRHAMSDPDPLPRAPDRERQAPACLDVDEKRVAAGRERRPRELVSEPRQAGQLADQTVQCDVPELSAAGQSADVVVDGAVLADDERPSALVVMLSGKSNRRFASTGSTGAWKMTCSICERQ